MLSGDRQENGLDVLRKQVSDPKALERMRWVMESVCTFLIPTRSGSVLGIFTFHSNHSLMREEA